MVSCSQTYGLIVFLRLRPIMYLSDVAKVEELLEDVHIMLTVQLNKKKIPCLT